MRYKVAFFMFIATHPVPHLPNMRNMPMGACFSCSAGIFSLEHQEHNEMSHSSHLNTKNTMLCRILAPSPFPICQTQETHPYRHGSCVWPPCHPSLSLNMNNVLHALFVFIPPPSLLYSPSFPCLCHIS